MAKRIRSRSMVIAVIVTAGLLAIPLVAWAASFTDVPVSHPFYTEIESIKKAGITQGSTECGPAATPAYCPDSLVRRDAMAAFMERGFSRVEGASGDVLANDVSTGTLATASIQPGATGAGTNGYARIAITGTAFAETNCPCLVYVGISDNGTVVGASATITTAIDPGQFAYQVVVPVAGDTTHSYSFLATVYNSNVSLTESSTVFGEISAIYVPFDGDANNSSLGAASFGSQSSSDLEGYVQTAPSGELARTLEVFDRLAKEN